MEQFMQLYLGWAALTLVLVTICGVILSLVATWLSDQFSYQDEPSRNTMIAGVIVTIILALVGFFITLFTGTFAVPTWPFVGVIFFILVVRLLFIWIRDELL